MSHHPYELITFRWKHIEIELTYHPCWGVIPDGVMSHLDIKSIDPPRAPLPITETGYLSHFFHYTKGDTRETILKATKDWLDKEAQNEIWKKHEIESNQLSLF
ncbi:hypothetical protein MLD52_09630 [Puniceicoccaceae bacterium K14]|nr:hypothetical protein [Puniceicoccaceae bacterium K14]